MSWVGWVLLATLLIGVRMAARRWVWSRWLTDDLTDGQAKLGLFLTTFGPIFAVGLAISLAAPFPRSVALFALISVGLAPAIGLGAASIDYMAKHGVKDATRRQGRDS
jgi:hypothetical protein